MKRILLLAVTSLVVGTATFFVVRGFRSEAQPAGRRPFTATILERRFAADGREVYSEYVTYAARSDGSSVRVFHRQYHPGPDQPWWQPKLVTDVASKKIVSVDPATDSLTTYPLSSFGANFYKTPRTSCTDDPNPERDTRLGYEIVRVQKTHSVPNRVVIHNDNWLAPALDCFPLRESGSLSAPGGAPARNIREVVSLSVGEPAPWLFEIPAGYVERAPSEVFAEEERRFGRRGASPETATKLDDAYHSRRR